MSIIKTIALVFTFWTSIMYGQRPQEIQLDEEPFDFTDPVKLIMIFIIPIILLAVGVFWIRKRKEKASKQQESEK